MGKQKSFYLLATEDVLLAIKNWSRRVILSAAKNLVPICSTWWLTQILSAAKNDTSGPVFYGKL
ncbi:MAG TPA: hypothetical protein VFQ30_18260 [Ktedonobacteraceae bacterium]|nr:hypothetical protein [Ktedonobacteraceae bacterium]